MKGGGVSVKGDFHERGCHKGGAMEERMLLECFLVRYMKERFTSEDDGSD